MVDLHLHLSGAVAPEDLWQLIVESGFKTGIKSYHEFLNTIDARKSGTLNKYIEILHKLEKIQSSPYAMKFSAFSAAKHSFLGGCTELLLRWNPYKRSQNFAIDLDSLIVSARSGIEEAESIFGLKCRMLLCMGRDCTTEQNEAIYKMAERYLDKGVVGIDVAGPYSGKKNKEFIDMYKRAKKRKMITTIHTGEVAGSYNEEEIRCALEDCEIQRIGHGIQISAFPKLMGIASLKKVLFEICPSSNLSTGAIKDIHELRRITSIFTMEQINYKICTDSTFPLKTDIIHENRLHSATY